MSRTLSILFVNGLARDVTESDLFRELNEFAVFSIKIPKDQQTGEPLGYCFIAFKSVNQAESAMKLLNYRKFHKKTLRAYWFNRNLPSIAKNPDFNVFIKNLSKSITHSELDQKFSFYGKIISAKIQEDEEGESLGFGFIMYDNLASVDLAIKELHGTEWQGKRIYVGKYIKKKPKLNKFNNVYVKNIPAEFTEEQIQEYFGKYGEISSLIVKAPQEQELMKFSEEKKELIMKFKYAFICFKKFEDAEKVVNTVPYLSLNDEKHNDELRTIVKILKDKQIPEKNLYKAALYFKESYEDCLSLLINSSNESKLKSALKSFQSLMHQTGDFYASKQKLNTLECFQGLKKKERAKRTQEIFQKHKQMLQQTNLLCNLYVKNLNPEISECGFKQIFEKFGALKSFNTRKHTEVDRFSVFKTEAWLIGFVSYVEEDSAKKAKKELNCSIYYSKPGLKLFVDYFESKQQREFSLKAKKKLFFLTANNLNDKNALGDKDAKVADDKRLLNFSRKRDFNPFPAAEIDNASKSAWENKEKDEINLKNRLDFVVGNDFDFVFAKFRKLFGIVINSENAQQADKAISAKADFLQASGFNLGKSLEAEDVPLKNSNPYMSSSIPLTRLLNKCLLEGNKFDLGKENMDENYAEDSDKSNNYPRYSVKLMDNFSIKNKTNSLLAPRNLIPNPIIALNYNAFSSFPLRNHFANPSIPTQPIPISQQIPSANLVNNSSFNEREGKPNMLIKQDPHLNNLAPLMMTFEKKFFTAPTQIEDNKLPVSQLNPSSSGFTYSPYLSEEKLKANHLNLLFTEKLNSFNCFAALRYLFPKIIEKILIEEPEYLQKMYLDDNYFVSQVKKIINFFVRSEKL